MRLHQLWEKLWSDINPQRALAAFVVGLIGMGLLVGGILWKISMCERECSCTPNRCCKISSSCPSKASCLCSSDENDWTKGACEEMDTDFGKLVGLAMGISIVGLCAACPLAYYIGYLLPYIIYFAVFNLCICTGSLISMTHTSFTTLFSKLRLGSKVSPAELANV